MMNNAQQDMSPDFVLMRLVSAAEYDRLDEPDDLRSGGGGFGPVKAALGHHGNSNINGGFDLDRNGPSTGLGSASPHYSSPLPGKGEMDGGIGMGLGPTAPVGSEEPLTSPSLPTMADFSVAAQHFVDYPVPHAHGAGSHGSRAQLMVFQNLLRSSDGILECGLEQPPSGFLRHPSVVPGGGDAEKRRPPHLEPGSVVPDGTTTNSQCVLSLPPVSRRDNTHSISTAEDGTQQQQQHLQWHPALKLAKVPSDSSQAPQEGVQALESDTGSVLCHRHRLLLTDRLAKWPPGLLDQSLHLSLLDPMKNCTVGGDDPVLALARQLSQLGRNTELREMGEGGDGREELVLPLTRCSCHGVLTSATGGMGPGEDPSETSDALLVLEGLGSDEVGRLGDPGGNGGSGERGVGGTEEGTAGGGGAASVFSSGTLSGLMQQVHRLAEEAGVCTDQSCRPSLAGLGAAVSLPSATPLTDPHPTTAGTSTPTQYAPIQLQAPQAAAALAGLHVLPDTLQSSSSNHGHRPQHQHQSRSQPQSRATTPKLGIASGGAGRSASPLVVLEGEVRRRGAEGEKTPRGKSRKGGSLKVRLSKLFRTKSSSGGSGGLLDKRPSLASSTSSGGSLLDVWGSSSSNAEQDSSRLQVSRPQSAFSPVPFSPPFTDDFSGPPQQQQQPPGGSFLVRNMGASLQSLPPRPLALPPSISTIQHSLSLNDTFLRGLPRPIPLRPDGQQPPPPRLGPRPLLCPLSRPDASSFATSLRELEKCGWYWGPMNWEDAEMKLKGKADGSFLVRDSSDPRYILSLSFRSQGVTHHTRMEHYRGGSNEHCCVPLCTGSSRYNTELSFHRFPKHTGHRTQWLHKIRRTGFTITPHTKVCSRHFTKDQIRTTAKGRRVLTANAIPTLFEWNAYSNETRAGVWERRTRPTSSSPEPGPAETEEEIVDMVPMPIDHDYVESAAVCVDREQYNKLREEVEMLRQQVQTLHLQNSFGLQRFESSPEDIRFYTRFPSYEHLIAFWNLVSAASLKMVRVTSTRAKDTSAETSVPRPTKLLPIDELFLFLSYLSTGCTQRELGHRFNIHRTTVSRIIVTWANFLYSLLGSVCIWMSPAAVKACLPVDFHGSYGDTQVVLDCTELRCQTPSSLLLQSEVFSAYKSHCTFKAMVGMAPHGALTFVSALFEGSMSDKEVFRQSGITSLLTPDMAIMVDKGFLVDDLVPGKVHRPAFLSKKTQMSEVDVLETQSIARLRVHVERLIRRVKENKLFETTIPLSISGSINQLFTVACTFSLWCHPKFEDRCHSVVEFIERAIMHSKNGKFLYFLRSRVPGLPPTPVQLLYPVSRFSSVKSLQHLCRFCIRQLVRIDHIQELPLPTPLIMYLRKFYYYDPEEETYPPIKEKEKEKGPNQNTQSGVESQTYFCVAFFFVTWPDDLRTNRPLRQGSFRTLEMTIGWHKRKKHYSD
ncbi:Suppressor of cytokine signaling 7 [Merluccius polli]|uniref:Suppressor of cytokine signaling 7 n=1 Tax=Merluccius polli TaxID=89951 RepID=A0AA47MYC9_MERPO|nr:Suppressor of cytokine signaling 7 [Merluccius polli]